MPCCCTTQCDSGFRRLSDCFRFSLGPRLDARDSHLTPRAGVAINGKAKPTHERANLQYSVLALPVGSGAENIYFVSALMRASRQLRHS
jgi:hypothetical protein